MLCGSDAGRDALQRRLVRISEGLGWLLGYAKGLSLLVNCHACQRLSLVTERCKI